ncbi:MAG TPA: trigger factor [Candidatus Saccharimonadales bacterium]|nr:trigger factor [Candidatus Saccharimonadales bacterium]
MQLKRENLSPTKVKLTITTDQKVLDDTKQHVLGELGATVKVPGFRAGKAPAKMLEKQLDQNVLQAEVLEHAVNRSYAGAVQQEKLRPIAPPQISITKFVPFTTLEFVAELETVGDIKLADYKKIKLAPAKVSITAKDVDAVLADLLSRAAEREGVKRAAKTGDEATIDFKGVDAKTKEAIAGADGQGYPLILGSNSFIPGFEDNIIGMKVDEEKAFTLTFPKDYGVASLQNRKVTFTVTVKKLEALTEPKLDDAFAAKVGPFKTLADLKKDVKSQLTIERERQAKQAFENELLETLAAKSTIALPDSLLDEEIERMEDEEKRNLAYRGQTWQEHLDEEKVTAEEHHEKQRPVAELRVKAGLVLSEVAEKEQLTVTPEELEVRLQLLKGQYTDAAMQTELDNPDNRRDIMNRILAEKAIAKLTEYAAKASKAKA